MACGPTDAPDDTLTGSSPARARSLPLVCEAVTGEIRARGLADLANLQQKIDRAKKSLWALTAAARPEPARIEAMMAVIGQLEHAQQELFTRNIEAWMAERCAACRAGNAEGVGPASGTPRAELQP